MIKNSATIDSPVAARNRRSEPRFPTNQTAVVTLLDSPLQETIHGRIIDYSASGIALLLPVSLAEGSRLEIRWPLGRVLAEVRNCRRTTGRKYRVGLKLNRTDHRNN